MVEGVADRAGSALELVFLGTAAAFAVPAFFCSCAVCQEMRTTPGQRRTRSSVALIGRETALIDTGPDVEQQLERERITWVERVFLTHWHYDHIGGLSSLFEPRSCAHKPPVEVYLPRQDLWHFDHELSYLTHSMRLHPVQPGDRIELPDATWEVVKTTHTDNSVGYVIQAGVRLAYLIDGVAPPAETVARLGGLDLLILEATLDELEPGEDRWLSFSLPQAVAFWHQTGVPRCVLTHLSCHRWLEGRRMVAGLSMAERREYEAGIPGLTFAYDGMRLRL